VDLKLSKLCPSDCIVFYNLACSYSLIGELERAFDCIRRSIDLGYDDLSHMSNDPDLRNLRGDSRYDEIVELIASRQKPRE
jgi:hypothetical protein